MSEEQIQKQTQTIEAVEQTKEAIEQMSSTLLKSLNILTQNVETAEEREERLRKAANEREDALKQAHAQEHNAKVARLEMNNPFVDPFARQTPSNLPPGLPGLPMGVSNPFGPSMSDLERLERERAQHLQAAMAAASPSRSPYPQPPGTPIPVSAGFGSHLSSLENRRQVEEMQRHLAERQYAERMSALASTDPLVRLQLAGVSVNPEIPHSLQNLHPAYASQLSSLMAAGNPLAGGPPRLPPGFDPRFRLPTDLLSRPQPGFSPRAPPIPPDQLQMQFMMEQEQRMRAVTAAASASQHASLMAHQEEYLRMEQAARQHQQASVSRP